MIAQSASSTQTHASVHVAMTSEQTLASIANSIKGKDRSNPEVLLEALLVAHSDIEHSHNEFQVEQAIFITMNQNINGEFFTIEPTPDGYTAKKSDRELNLPNKEEIVSMINPGNLTSRMQFIECADKLIKRQGSTITKDDITQFIVRSPGNELDYIQMRILDPKDPMKSKSYFIKVPGDQALREEIFIRIFGAINQDDTISTGFKPLLCTQANEISLNHIISVIEDVLKKSPEFEYAHKAYIERLKYDESHGDEIQRLRDKAIIEGAQKHLDRLLKCNTDEEVIREIAKIINEYASVNPYIQTITENGIVTAVDFLKRFDTNHSFESPSLENIRQEFESNIQLQNKFDSAINKKVDSDFIPKESFVLGYSDHSYTIPSKTVIAVKNENAHALNTKEEFGLPVHNHHIPYPAHQPLNDPISNNTKADQALSIYDHSQFDKLNKSIILNNQITSSEFKPYSPIINTDRHPLDNLNKSIISNYQISSSEYKPYSPVTNTDKRLQTPSHSPELPYYIRFPQNINQSLQPKTIISSGMQNSSRHASESYMSIKQPMLATLNRIPRDSGLNSPNKSPFKSYLEKIKELLKALKSQTQIQTIKTQKEFLTLEARKKNLIEVLKILREKLKTDPNNLVLQNRLRKLNFLILKNELTLLKRLVITFKDQKQSSQNLLLLKKLNTLTLKLQKELLKLAQRVQLKLTPLNLTLLRKYLLLLKSLNTQSLLKNQPSLSTQQRKELLLKLREILKQLKDPKKIKELLREGMTLKEIKNIKKLLLLQIQSLRNQSRVLSDKSKAYLQLLLRNSLSFKIVLRKLTPERLQKLLLLLQSAKPQKSGQTLTALQRREIFLKLKTLRESLKNLQIQKELIRRGMSKKDIQLLRKELKKAMKSADGISPELLFQLQEVLDEFLIRQNKRARNKYLNKKLKIKRKKKSHQSASQILEEERNKVSFDEEFQHQDRLASILEKIEGKGNSPLKLLSGSLDGVIALKNESGPKTTLDIEQVLADDDYSNMVA